MMKETRIMKVFEQYVKQFDMNKGNVKAMYFHSLKMMELCKSIASNIGVFSEEEIVICGFMGLFHNIGMFSNKVKNFIVLDDDMDKTKEGIELLFGKDGLIRKITDDTMYDDVIKVALYCQYKYGLPQGFDSKTLHFCMVLQDANVIEKFRMVANYPCMDMYIDYYPNDLIYNDFKQFKVITSKSSDNDSDKILGVMSSIFGVHYSYSYSLMKDEECVNKLVGALKISDRGIGKFFYQIASVLNMYVDKKINC